MVGNNWIKWKASAVLITGFTIIVGTELAAKVAEGAIAKLIPALFEQDPQKFEEAGKALFEGATGAPLFCPINNSINSN